MNPFKLNPKAKIMVYRHPVNMGLGYNGLSVLIGPKADNGNLYVFINRKRSAMKILFHDGSGLCLFCKRIAGSFADTGKVLSMAELTGLINQVAEESLSEAA